MVGYRESIERKMVNLYTSLNEKDRRRYAAIETETAGSPVNVGHVGSVC